MTATRLAEDLVQAISSRPAPGGERPYSFSCSAGGISSLQDLLPAPPPRQAEPSASLSFVLHSLHSYQPDKERKAPGGEKDPQCSTVSRLGGHYAIHAGAGGRTNLWRTVGRQGQGPGWWVRRPPSAGPAPARTPGSTSGDAQIRFPKDTNTIGR